MKIEVNTKKTIKAIKTLKKSMPTVKIVDEHKAFEKAVKPLMKYLSIHHHPHTCVIVDATFAEILEGKMTINFRN